MKKILVVVDMQNDFIDGALGTPEAQAIVQNVVKRIKGFEGKIYYTRDTHRENYMDTMEGKNLPIVHCVEYSHGWKIRHEVMEASMGKEVVVVDKPTFGSTELVESIFKDSKKVDEGKKDDCGIESITLIGLCTDICVISNAINLKSKLWETPIIVEEACCAGVTRESHRNAVEAMKMCQIAIV